MSDRLHYFMLIGGLCACRPRSVQKEEIDYRQFAIRGLCFLQHHLNTTTPIGEHSVEHMMLRTWASYV
eukprot:scaffold66262_cov29-Tisochrysis_lutea.AAC.2